MSHSQSTAADTGDTGDTGQHARRQDDRAVPSVLIAEDEGPIAEALGAIVEEAGYRAVLARDGRRALELARQQWPALVISDYMMPYVSGPELMQALRDEAHALGRPAPPVALMSAVGRLYADRTGADAIIHKPFDIAEIEAILHRFIEAPARDGA